MFSKIITKNKPVKATPARFSPTKFTEELSQKNKIDEESEENETEKTNENQKIDETEGN